MELLAPVKNKEYAFLAINLKVDAIYCSGPLYSARYHAGIGLDDLKDIVNYAHLYETKVYITVNTMLFSESFDKVKEYIDDLVLLGIDALIIQDLGLLTYLRKSYPQIELHASTQMHIHNEAGVAFLEKNQVSRIVLARELALTNIKNIKKIHPTMALETFIHGALCTSYSGQCYYGAYYEKGSGNLGTCEQFCRKHHSLASQKNSILSLRDLAITTKIKELDGTVDSLKIEGRLKSKEYLFSTIKYYQGLLNDEINQEAYDNMQIAFNRTYTKGRMFNKNGHELANPLRINNTGLEVGEIIEWTPAFLIIKISKPLYRLDNIRIVTKKEEYGQVVESLFYKETPVEQVNAGLIKIDNKHNLKEKGIVYIVKTRRLEKAITANIREYINKIEVSLTVEVKIGQPLKISYQDSVYLSDFIVEKAIKAGMSKEDLSLQLSKVNNTPFCFDLTITGDDDFFIVKSLLNDFKRKVVAQLYEARIKRLRIKKETVEPIESRDVDFKGYLFMIKTYQQALALYEHGVEKIYVDKLELLDEVKDLFKEVIPVLPRVIKDENFNHYLKQVNEYSRVMVSELGMLAKLQDKELETNYALNVANEYALSLLRDNNVKNAIIALEQKNILQIPGLNSTRLVYGHIPLMIMDYCPINANKDDNCQDCLLCQEKQYYLYNDEKDKLPLVYAYDNILELYSPRPLNYLNEDKQADYSMVSLTIETYGETLKILEEIK